MRNRIIQTIWFEPMRLSGVNPYLHMSLAYASAKSIRNQGYDVVLYTDIPDAFVGFPYNDIIEVNMNGFNPSMFAAIKYEALKKEPLKTVHMDYDIILTKPCIPETISEDILIQSVESPMSYKKEAEFIRNSIPKGIQKYGLSDTPFCFGVIGFFNETLKQIFLENYFNAIELYKNVSIPKGIIIDRLLEQAATPKICEYENYKEAHVVDFYTSNRFIGKCRYSKDDNVGFIHYSGKSKWDSKIVEMWSSEILRSEKLIIAKNYCNCKKIKQT